MRWRVASVPVSFIVGEETALLASLAGRPGEAHAQATVSVRTRPGWRAHPRSERRDSRPPRIDRTLRAVVVPRARDGGRAGNGTRERLRRDCTPRGLRDRARLDTRRPRRSGARREPSRSTHISSAATSAPGHASQSLPLTAASGLGAGIVVALPETTCALAETARVARYLATQSAGQCGPCVHGLAALAGGLEQLAHGRGADRAQLARWTEEVRGRGACRHPDGAAGFIASSLATFTAETATHLQHGRCRHRDCRHPARRSGGVSKILRLDPIACDGHGLCAELFPERIRLDDWGFPILDPRAVPPALDEHARRAVAECPKLALRLAERRSDRP